MANSKTADQHILQDISRIAQNIQSLCNVPPSSQSSDHDSDVLTRFRPQLIPSATTISPQLEGIGLSSGFAAKVSNAYLKSCNDLRATCESSLRKAIESSKALVTTATVQDMVRIWSAVYSQQTNVWAESAFTRAREWVSNTRSRNSSQPKKSSFNHEYTPLLEKYFEYNAYPSAPDRAVLARKSMMTPRQIEVWFQNHRNRAKKEGRPLRKLSSDRLPLELSLQSLEQRMPFFTVPEYERKAVIESDTSESEASEQEDSGICPEYPLSANTGGNLAIAAPPHAFPTTYPPSGHYVPFPCKSGKPVLPAPVWARKPATSLRPRAIGDFDDFVVDFSAKLQLTESPSNNGRRRNHSPSTNTLQPWFAATHTYAPPAPHPAFIRSSSIQVMPSRSSAIPVVSAPPSRLHPFRSPSPCSPPASLVPSSQTATSVRRKVARLPKRSPNRQSMAHRGVSPATSEASLLPSSRCCSLTSRVSSFNLDSTTQRRPSSSSSSSSSSTLTTPELSPAMLPCHAQSPVSVAGIDFQELDGLLAVNTSSPNEGLQLNFRSEHGFNIPVFTKKQPFRFGFEAPSLDDAREHS